MRQVGLRYAGLFHVANSLHTNFYEGWLGVADVSLEGIEAVKELLALLAPHTGRNEV